MSLRTIMRLGNDVRNGDNINRSSQSGVYTNMSKQLISMGLTPPIQPKASAPLDIEGTTTDAQMTSLANPNQSATATTSAVYSDNHAEPTTGQGLRHRKVNHFHSLYTDNDIKIRSLHPAFHPVPILFLKEQLQPM